MADQEEKEFHVVMFPWLAFGHMIPFFELSKSLASKGMKITFFSTPRNIERLPRIPQELSSKIDLVGVPLPPTDGLPAYAEATIDLELDKVQYLKKAYDGLREPFQKLVESISPDWIVHDFACYWVSPLVAELGIPCAFYLVFSAASASFFGPPIPTTEEAPNIQPEWMTVTPAWYDFPSPVKYRLYEAMFMFRESTKQNASGVPDEFRFSLCFQGCQAILVRSCNEYEGEYLAVLDRFHTKPVLPVGLLPADEAIWDQNAGPSWPECSNWLDSQKPKSVLFVAFGTETKFTDEQIQEIAFGLELCNLPFLWVLRVKHGDDPEAALPKGFRDRTAPRGLVCTEWVPQVKVLAHGSVGACLNPSGVSSVIESLQFGHPLVLLPMVYDQGLNARLLVERKLGFEVERDEETGDFTRFDIAKALRLVVVEEGGERIRATAKEMVSVFGNKELHDGYVRKLAQWLRQQKDVHHE